MKNFFGKDYYSAANQQNLDYNMQIVTGLLTIATAVATFGTLLPEETYVLNALQQDANAASASVGKTSE